MLSPGEKAQFSVRRVQHSATCVTPTLASIVAPYTGSSWCAVAEDASHIFPVSHVVALAAMEEPSCR